MRELNPKQQQQVRNLIPRGMTLRAIAETIHKSQVETRNYLVKANLLDAFEAQLQATQLITAAMGEHLTAHKIAQQYNLDFDFVVKRMAGIKANELGEIEHPDPLSTNKNKGWNEEQDILLSYFFDVEKLNRHQVAAKLFRTSAAVTTRIWERSVGSERAKNRPMFDLDNPEHCAIVDNYNAISKVEPIQDDNQAEEQVIYEGSLNNVIEQDSPIDGEVRMVVTHPDLLAQTIQNLTAQGLRCVLVG